MDLEYINDDTLLQEILQIVKSARAYSLNAVNHAMVQAYWNIGKLIFENEQKSQKRSKYGKHLIENLSLRLTEELGKGFTSANLKYMRQFYMTFPISHATGGQLPGLEISHALSDQLQNSANQIENTAFMINPILRPEISWTHYRLLLKLDKKEARDFYIDEIIENNWSTRQLERQINTHYFERIISSRDSRPVRDEANSNQPANTAKDFVKDPYILEFLDMNSGVNFLEKDLETALINKIREFLLELGKGFAFVDRQKRIKVEDDHFYIDLVFYNYILKCFILIDLKVGKLTHQDIGQMDMYVRLYEDFEKLPGDNPTIGIILCSEKNMTVAKYSVLSENENLFASKYLLHLPSIEELTRELKNEREKLEIEESLGNR